MKFSFLYDKSLFHIVIISIPFLSFINTNIHELDSVIIRTIFFLFLITILIIFFVTKFLLFFTKKKDFKVVHFTLVVAFFLLFFLYTFFKDLFHLLVPAYKGEISFAIIIIVFLFFYLFYKR